MLHMQAGSHPTIMSVLHSSDSTDFDGDIPKFKLTPGERVHDISKELMSLDSFTLIWHIIHIGIIMARFKTEVVTSF